MTYIIKNKNGYLKDFSKLLKTTDFSEIAGLYVADNFTGNRKLIDVKNVTQISNYPIYYTCGLENKAQHVLDCFSACTDLEVSFFTLAGFKIVLGRRDEIKHTGIEFGKVAGYFSYFERAIVLVVEDTGSIENLTDLFYHEWGHYVDWVFGEVSKTKLFRQYYKKYVSKYCLETAGTLCSKRQLKQSYYEMTDVRELFAFQYSKLKRGKKLVCPTFKSFLECT